MNDAITRNEMRAVGLLLIGALLLRLITLSSESFWLDESIIWSRVQASLGDMLTDWDSDTQGPLYTLIIWPWSILFGLSEFSLRLPSVFFGVLGVHIVYLLGRRLYNHSTAMWAAVFAAINPFLIHYSQEARPYTLWFWITLLSVWCLLRLIEKFSLSNSLAYVLSTLAALYTHPYGPFLLALQLIVAIALKPWQDWKRLLLHALVVLMCYAPMAYMFLDTFSRKIDDSGAAGGWITRPDVAAPAHYLKAFFGWNVLGAAAGLALVAGLIVFRKELRKFRTGVLICIAFGLAFFALPWLVSQKVPILWPRFAIPALGGLLLLLGLITSQTKKPLQIIAVGLFLLGTAVPLYHYYTKLDKGPWRQMMEKVTPLIAERDAIMIYPKHALSALTPYSSLIEEHSLLYLENSVQIADAIPDTGVFWVITANYHDTEEVRQALYTNLENRCDCDSTMKSTDLYTGNPFVQFIEEIEITRCSAREQVPLQP